MKGNTMGGINPPAPTDHLMTLAQQFTLALCSINQHFWEGHSEIERGVLIEADLADHAERHIEKAQTAFANAAHAAEEAQKSCMRTLHSLMTDGEDTKDLAMHLKHQLPRLIAIGGGMETLRGKMVPAALRKNQQGTLQAGMLFEREQSSIRHESLHLISALSEMLAAHSHMVAKTNALVDLAA
jgi:hypothetical protein